MSVVNDLTNYGHILLTYCHQQSPESFRYVNMTTLLSRTANCHNASLLQYSPGNDQSINQSINQKRIKVTKVTNVTARPLLQC